MARDLETFAAALENLAAEHGTTRAAGIRGTIERLEEVDRRRSGGLMPGEAIDPRESVKA